MVTKMSKRVDKTASDLKRRVLIFLSQRGVSSLRRLNIQVDSGIVTLRGTVSSFYERQLCLCCHRVAGVHRVVDDLTVELPARITAGLPAVDGSTEIPTQTGSPTGLT